MEDKKKRLGRGLSALLGDNDFDLDAGLNEVPMQESKKNNTEKLHLELIHPGSCQPRSEFDQEALEALAQSIKSKGVLQPLLVRADADGYELIAGERRWRAAKLAGLTEVPVIIKDFSDQEALEVALVENLLRENLSPIEEAEGFQRLINEFSHTQEALAQVIGKSRSHIANTLRLLSLPEKVKNLVKENKLSAGHARALVGLENAETLAEQIIAKDLNVRQVEDLVAKQKAPRPSAVEKKAAKDEDLAEIEQDLVRKLGLRIKITPSKQGGGKIVLQYASVAELDMILDLLDKEKQPVVPNTVFKAPEPASGEKFSIKIVD